MLRAALIRLMRIPPEPEPPAGSAASVRVFRAARNFYRYSVFRWALKQVAALVGILLLIQPELLLRAFSIPDPIAGFLGRIEIGFGADGETLTGDTLALFLLSVVELIGLGLLIVQIPFTFMLVRLNYELRWYIVTDRSLRVREGIVRVREMTMTYANIQNLTIQQGPIQRLLGISDLRVRTAGGGESSSEQAKEKGEEESMHIAYFRGVDNAAEIRDVILARLRGLRGSGLGDPDDIADDEPSVESSRSAASAAHSVLDEARALRTYLESQT